MGRYKKPITFADRLRYVRKIMGLSQREMAAKLHLSDKAVSSYEVGRSSPTLETLQLLGKLTKRPVSYFFDDESQEGLEIAYKLDRIEEELRQIRKYLESRAARQRSTGQEPSMEIAEEAVDE